MKSILVLTFTCLSTFLRPESVHAQSNCEELKKENEYLKKALNITTPIKTVTTANIDFNILKVEGNTKDQTVTVSMTFVNHDANEAIQYYNTQAIDVEGNEYKGSNHSIGSEGSRNTLFTDTPVKSTITFKKVLPSVKIMKLIHLHLLYNKPPNVKLEFRDLPITWK
ncbi:hypothetical protein [Chitinophaga sp.]|uniref:hypothetical protein n=1 Tax=Chitinophaga sp. TaxID=1869181 RepID=UPI0031E165CC